MRRSTFILLALVLGTQACRKADTIASRELPAIPVTTTSTASAPAWIDNPEPFSATGIEAPNPMGDLDFQRTAATAKARTRLARDLETQARSLFQQVAQTSFAVGEKLKSASGQRAQEEIVRQLTDLTLRGTQARRFWTDPKSGMLYVLVVADPALAQSSVRERIRQGLADLGAGQADLQEAVTRLDAALASRDKASQ
jgi:hypothetical protein